MNRTQEVSLDKKKYTHIINLLRKYPFLVICVSFFFNYLAERQRKRKFPFTGLLHKHPQQPRPSQINDRSLKCNLCLPCRGKGASYLNHCHCLLKSACSGKFESLSQSQIPNSEAAIWEAGVLASRLYFHSVKISFSSFGPLSRPMGSSHLSFWELSHKPGLRESSDKVQKMKAHLSLRSHV